MNQSTLTCPSCQAPYQSQDTACNTCGLIFATYAGAAMGATIPQTPASAAAAADACPHCGQPVRANAKVCGHCGGALVYQYVQLQSGQSLANGRYTVQQALSKGGMGAIYLATDHEAFDRTVVIKAMLDYFDPSNPQEVQAAQKRFLQEAKTLSTLRHPSIPQIYTYFQDGPHNYIVMEYIEGSDLEQQLTHTNDDTGQRIAGRPYPQGDVIRWGVALCRVLEYLAGLRPDPVVHHDIKPANVLLDRNSNEMRLVDFGTAKARLLVQQGGGVGLQKSSVFGTQGYAPPEQYKGQSEPRSDVYALAATLYHMATDDDPRSHPFSFPNLKKLGRLGSVLEGALQSDVAQRPTAAELRQQLEVIIAPGAKPIQAPDGTEIHSEQELVEWCERHWQQATDWLYRSLPDQIETFWGKNKLANDIRAGLNQYSGDRNAGLDAALVLLDPSGFGKEPPRLTADKTTLNFGSLPAGGKSSPLSLNLTNDGRRYASVSLSLPKWVSGGPLKFNLAPEQSTTITLTADMGRVRVGGGLKDKVMIGAGSAMLMVPTKAKVSLFRTLWLRWRVLWIKIWEPRWPVWVFVIMGSLWGLSNALCLYSLKEYVHFFLKKLLIFDFMSFLSLLESYPFSRLFHLYPLEASLLSLLLVATPIFFALGLKRTESKIFPLALISLNSLIGTFAFSPHSSTALRYDLTETVQIWCSIGGFAGIVAGIVAGILVGAHAGAAKPVIYAILGAVSGAVFGAVGGYIIGRYAVGDSIAGGSIDYTIISYAAVGAVTVAVIGSAVGPVLVAILVAAGVAVLVTLGGIVSGALGGAFSGVLGSALNIDIGSSDFFVVLLRGTVGGTLGGVLGWLCGHWKREIDHYNT